MNTMISRLQKYNLFLNDNDFLFYEYNCMVAKCCFFEITEYFACGEKKSHRLHRFWVGRRFRHLLSSAAEWCERSERRNLHRSMVNFNVNAFFATEAYADLQRVTISTPENNPKNSDFSRDFLVILSIFVVVFGKVCDEQQSCCP